MPLNLLKSLNHPVDGLRSKDWLEFAESDAPSMDFVFTVCDQAAGEVCPIWPGQPMSAHWGLPDPGGSRRNGCRNRRRLCRDLSDDECAARGLHQSASEISRSADVAEATR